MNVSRETSEIREITAELIDAFVLDMRPDDLEEMQALSGTWAEDALRDVTNRSVHTFAGLMDGIPLFMGGVVPLEDVSIGRAWMLGNPGIARAKKFYLRETRLQVRNMLYMFDKIVVYVDDRYTRSLRWLSWLGFAQVQTYLIDGRRVLLFEKVANV